ncbi:hypothetical protein [Paraburkholderia sp. J8-2]|uniref:hypothetical protein n=1 Tax=Paraburkholderia sp. J8-2 TaxID=2805440 RepID=UPI002AB683C2|nr:hypothetical protein [Paraburkholderia sp. J8-2]
MRKPNAAQLRAEMLAVLAGAGAQVIGMTLDAMNGGPTRRALIARAATLGGAPGNVDAHKTAGPEERATTLSDRRLIQRSVDIGAAAAEGAAARNGD